MMGYGGFQKPTRFWRGAFPLVVLAGLSACGSLPAPFAGQPGSLGARLAEPPPTRLAVPAPDAAGLSPAGGAVFAQAVADDLDEAEVPAVAQPAKPGDWRLAIHPEMSSDAVVPVFTVFDPTGAAQGSVRGNPLPAQAWQSADAPALKQAAREAAPKIADLLTRIDAKVKQSDPNSLYNRPARVAVIGVQGAPGDGNESLVRQMKAQLPKLDMTVQDDAKGADFVVAGLVRTAPVPATDLTRVEIVWQVVDAAGHDLGRVVQMNDVPNGTLDHFWGDVAVAVAQEAAAGVKEMILKQTSAGAGGKAASAPTASAPTASGPASSAPAAQPPAPAVPPSAPKS
ncbi:MAG: hypothetical protein IRZ23_02720 [Acetobacteraceae bacterium]|nr:hypothetical protein [Acetobacteraceae bacterium]